MTYAETNVDEGNHYSSSRPKDTQEKKAKTQSSLSYHSHSNNKILYSVPNFHFVSDIYVYKFLSFIP